MNNTNETKGKITSGVLKTSAKIDIENSIKLQTKKMQRAIDRREMLKQGEALPDMIPITELPISRGPYEEYLQTAKK